MLVTGVLTLHTMFVGAGSLGGIIHVPADVPTIQTAIEEAQPFDTIIVAPGTYHESVNFLNKAITVLSSEGATATIIDATGLSGSVVTCSSGEGQDTVLDGFTITGGTGTFIGPTRYGGGMLNYYSSPTVTNCTFSGNTANSGGGMCNYYSRPTVTGCTFVSNTPGRGGGMYNFSSDPTVSHCLFSGNTATVNDSYSGGGGMYNQSSSPTVTDCTFSGNTATSYGGAMYNSDSSPRVTNCSFSGNSAYNGGGFYNFGTSSPTVVDCAFAGNSACFAPFCDGAGGGINNNGGNPEVTRCTFIGNTAQHGGGMYNGHGSPTVTRCGFEGNIASGGGGGMYNNMHSPTTVRDCAFSENTAESGGGMFNNESNSTVTKCAFTGNTANSGGGMQNQQVISTSSATVINCTFSGNTADLYGGGMNNTGSRPTVANCTFSANTATSGGGLCGGGTVADCIFWRDSPNEIVNGSSALTIRFSDVHGGFPVGATNGGGNIYLDPLFVRLPNPGPDGTWDGVDDDYGDLRLRSGSPCINAGDPAFVASPGETDFDGHARVLCGRVDMGAYEFGIGDYDCDQTVDLIDFANWSACMTAPTGAELRISNSEERMTNLFDLLGVALPPIGNWQLQIGPGAPGSPLRFDNPCAAFDFDGDGDVDLRDFAGFELVLTP